jgi:hypothetical protein
MTQQDFGPGFESRLEHLACAYGMEVMARNWLSLKSQSDCSLFVGALGTGGTSDIDKMHVNQELAVLLRHR